MTLATTLRRTYTTARQNDDDSQSSDDSLLVSSTSRTSQSEKSTHASEKKSIENIVKNTTNTEVGKPTEKSTKNTTGSDAIPQPEHDQKIIAFFEKLKNHKDQKPSKKDLVEEFIRSNPTEVFMRDMNAISDKEIDRLTGSKLKKWASMLGGGVFSQNTSFLLASEIAMATNQAWLFPVLATILSEGLSDKLAGLTRRTTFTTNDAKNLFRKQDLIAEAIGDMIRQYYFLKPEAKHKSNNPAHKGERFTAWDALWKDSDYFLEISSSNCLNRGLPFLCFTGTYLVRDFLLQGMLKDATELQKFFFRWGSGGIAGGSTALLSQIITSFRKGAVELPGYSTSYWHAKETYLHSVRGDIRDSLKDTKELTDTALNTKFEKLLLDLDKKIQREIGVAGLKKSLLTAIPGEIKASIHRQRPEDSLDPEVPGTLEQSIHSAIGKFISLIFFTYCLDQSMKSENKTGSFSPYPAVNLMFLPFALIWTGYMLRDDLQIISRTAHSVAKAVRDVTTGRAAYQERNAKPLDDVTTNMPEQINANNENGNNNGNDADNRFPTGRKVTFADKASKEKLTDRQREARDRKHEYEKKEEASTTASYANEKRTNMSGSPDSDRDDDSSKDDSKSARSSDKVTGSSSSSSQSASRSSTKTYGNDDSSSSEYT